MQKKQEQDYAFETKLLVAGKQHENFQGHLTPIYATTSFTYDTCEQGLERSMKRDTGYLYSRYGSPNSTEIEKKIAALETHGLDLQVSAIMFATGMAAISTLFISYLKAGEKVLCTVPVYGGTQTLLNDVLSNLKIQAVYSDFQDLNKIEQILKNDPLIKLVHIESPCNPTCLCTDLEKASSLAHKYNAKISIDSTFASPYLQQPFKYGIDFVIHSTTKFLNGHGSALGGILLGKDIEFMESKALKTQRMLGSNSNPFDCFLLGLGIKTLALRMEKICSNAIKVATFLESHPQVIRVFYPGLKSHPSYQIAQKQMKLPGGMLSFEIKGGFNSAKIFFNKLKLCVKTVSLGNVDTLICHPASTTHAFCSKEQKDEQQITEGLIRVSVGIENVQDIIKDLQQSFEMVAKL